MQLGPLHVYTDALSDDSMIRRALAWAAYPVLLLGPLLASWLLLGQTESVPLATASTVIAVAILLWPLERLAPFEASWAPDRRAFTVDTLHSLMSSLVVAPLVRGVGLAAVAASAVAAAQSLGITGWPTGWPLPVQVAAAVVLADLGAYWAHRVMHLTRLGWRLHVVHHSSERLYFMAAGRAHPFNAVFTLTCETAPLVFLGATTEVLVLLTVFKGVNGLLQHSNVDFRPGWLSQVLATSDFHRWHHSRDLGESNTNFGNTTAIWDRVFRTMSLPDRPPRVAVGVDGLELPESYPVHLLAPFTLDRYERYSRARHGKFPSRRGGILGANSPHCHRPRRPAPR